MLHHKDLGNTAEERRKNVHRLITAGKIQFGGNKVLRIYGTLSCSSGKKMKVTNRVFFETEAEAVQAGYRPCGHCLKDRYRAWLQKQE